MDDQVGAPADEGAVRSAFDCLLDSCVAGEFGSPAGWRVTPTEIQDAGAFAAKHDLDPQAVREALAVMTRIGLVRYRPPNAFYSRSIESEVIDDVFARCELVLSAVARECVVPTAHFGENVLTRLASNLEEQDKIVASGDTSSHADVMLRLEEDFYATLAWGAGMNTSVFQVSRAFAYLRVYRSQASFVSARKPADVAEISRAVFDTLSGNRGNDIRELISTRLDEVRSDFKLTAQSVLV